MDSFRVRLNCIDHYQATPTRFDPQLRNDVRPGHVANGPKVPIIRIFGSTETGQKVCAHIHGAFPYLYVEYEGGLDPDEVGSYIYRLHLSIDHALAISYRRDQHGNNAKFVARITIVKGIPFYGFHVGYRFYLKIYMFNPIVMTRLADLLQQGVIMKHKFQPYEAHLEYLLQFMTDYNLYGCDYVNSTTTYFRSPVPRHNQDSNSVHLWHSRSIPDHAITNEVNLPRASHCSIEVDICVQHLTNRNLVRERLLHHDFTERANPIPNELKFVHSMAGLWEDETRRRKRQMQHSSQDSSPFPPDVLVSMSADSRCSQPQNWIHEEEYRDHIRELIIAEKDSQNLPGLEFATFVQPLPFEQSVKTAVKSVEDLFPSNLMPALGLKSDTDDARQDPTSSIEVDERGVRQTQHGYDEYFPNSSDDEALTALLSMEGKNIASRNGPLQFNKGARNFSEEKLRAMGIYDIGQDINDPPEIPIPQELVDFATQNRLDKRLSTPESVDIVEGEEEEEEEEEEACEQDLSSLASTPHPSKRIKLYDSPVDEYESTPEEAEEYPLIQIEPPPEELPKPESPSLPTKRIELPSNSNRTLNFGIVKDHNDPNTKLRLSQKSQSSQSSQLSSSQQSYDGGFTKQVSFNLAASQGGPDAEYSFIFSSITSSDLDFEIQDNSQTKIQEAIGDLSDSQTLIYSVPPPTAADVTSSMQDYDLPDVIYQDAYYSREKDVPARAREYAGRQFKLESNTLRFLPEFDPTATSAANYGLKHDTSLSKAEMRRAYKKQRKECKTKHWEIAIPPPTYDEVENWWLEKTRHAADPSSSCLPTPREYLSQIDGPTPKSKYDFKYARSTKSTSVEHEAQYMSTMSLELHVNTRGKFVPNPEEDEVQCIFWAFKSDETVLDSQNSSDLIHSGILVLSSDGNLRRQIKRQTAAEVAEEISELDLMVRMVEIVRTHDPDILTGYEVHGSSWGYLIERARLKYDYNLCDEFSRMKTESHGRFGKENDRWGFNTTSTIRVTGRHMINIWRAMRGELNLLQYTMENVVWHLLHRRIPHYPWKVLTTWYKSGKPSDLSQLLKYYESRSRLDIEILEANELVARTSEQARLLGVDFFSVFSRGSQFKVESIMFRIAKPENFMLVSPSRKQVGGQNALECLPLVMEPRSDFYNSPLLVLDFQSLYPSVMIAYNYCYSTFLGRVTDWRGMNKMGFTEYQRQQGVLALLEDHINISPNGMMYVKPEIRKSTLAKMLTEILETRIMVKSGMKQDKSDKTLQQLLNNRQLALKLLANVTYGYTSASFSGRMPCSEIADSIVQTGRETLERAVAFIHSVERWGAEVVYGDTDSLFVYLKGRTKDQAFEIGNEIAKAVTDMNPKPIKLKFEKVYHPCVLLAKKRYVGYKYESPEQVEPEFDAKGIETVRRDGTPAEQKIEEKALRLLFETADLSRIKQYFQKQCKKIMNNNVSVQDFCFAKEVRLGTYSDKGPTPAGGLISTKRMLQDARAEPQYGERVPYVVITGAPGAKLTDRCIAPEELLSNPHWRLDAEYYITKNLIPPLERIFNLVGANVRQWYDEVPKIQRLHRAPVLGGKRTTIDAYWRSQHCLICRRKFSHKDSLLCRCCRRDSQKSLQTLQSRVTTQERRLQEVLAICRSCSGLGPLENINCDSKDCPVFWTRMRQTGKVQNERGANEPAIQSLLKGVERLSLEW